MSTGAGKRDYALYNASRKAVANWLTISGPTALEVPKPIKREMENPSQWSSCGILNGKKMEDVKDAAKRRTGTI